MNHRTIIEKKKNNNEIQLNINYKQSSRTIQKSKLKTQKTTLNTKAQK